MMKKLWLAGIATIVHNSVEYYAETMHVGHGMAHAYRVTEMPSGKNVGYAGGFKTRRAAQTAAEECIQERG